MDPFHMGSIPRCIIIVLLLKKWMNCASGKSGSLEKWEGFFLRAVIQKKSKEEGKGAQNKDRNQSIKDV